MSNEKEIEKKVNLEGFAAHVELPEGHQLVLGELAPGTVVEVATWQGTGRPDETTNRFLLSASGPGLQRRQRREDANNDQVEAPEARAEIAHEAPSPIATESVTDEVRPAEIFQPVTLHNQSLGSVGGRSEYLGLKNFGVDNATPPVAPKSKFGIEKIVRPIFSAIAIMTIAGIILSLLGIAAVVPDRGAKTPFGSAPTSLVVYKKGNSVNLGVAAVAIVRTANGDTVLFGPTNSFDATTLQIETSAGQELVPANAVIGRAFLAIPFIGSIVKVFTR